MQETPVQMLLEKRNKEIELEERKLALEEKKLELGNRRLALEEAKMSQLLESQAQQN